MIGSSYVTGMRKTRQVYTRVEDLIHKINVTTQVEVHLHSDLAILTPFLCLSYRIYYTKY